MSRLFEEMQEARRRGELAVPEELTPEPTPRRIAFSPSAVAGAWVCDACFGLVDHRLTTPHTTWHHEMGA